MGRKFLAPDDVKDRQTRAADLVKRALKQLASGADAAAQKKLKEASKLDPDSLQADLINGVVRAVFRHKSEEAEKFFDIAVSRGRRQSGSLDAVGESNYAAALNNLALVKVRQRKLSAAYSCWKDLLEARPRPESEVIQNIGRVRALAARGQGTKSPAFLHPSRSVLKRFETLYGGLAIEGNAVAFEARTGWLYIPPILRGDGAKEAVEIGAPGSGPMDSQDMRLVGWGSGFVVHPGYVLTNRHVVRDERRRRNYAGFNLQKADFLGERYPGRVLAVSERFDLALIKSDGLVARPVSLLDRRPRLSEEIMVLGFPRPKALGFRFTTTKGIISSLPNRKFSQVLYDAISNAGNSGGPTVDIRGNAVAVHSMALVFGGENAKSYAGGVICTDVIPFLNRNIPNYRPNTRANKLEDWAAVTEVLDEAVVAIEILATTESLAGLPDAFAGKRDRKESWRALEDPWCMVCSGWGERKCPNKKCKNGTVRDFRWRVIRRPGVPDERVRDPIRVPCRTCRGKDKIRCVYCDDGFGP